MKPAKTPAAIEAEMRRCNGIVRRAHHRFYKGSEASLDGQAVTWSNPLDELIAREEEAERDAAYAAMEFLIADGASLPLALVEKVNAAARDSFQQYESALMEWLFAAGPHPLEVMRRLFAYAKMRNADLLWKMGFREVGPLLKETHAAAALRCKALFGDTPAGWKKKATACANMRQAQKGNRNRRGGKKLNGHAHTKKNTKTP